LRDHVHPVGHRRGGRSDAGAPPQRGDGRRRQPRRRDPGPDLRRGGGGPVILGTLTATPYLVLSAVLFSAGIYGLLTRRNPIVMFMCVELLLNAVNLTFVALARQLDDLGGQVAVFFVLVVAAAEVV